MKNNNRHQIKGCPTQSHLSFQESRHAAAVRVQYIGQQGEVMVAVNWCEPLLIRNYKKKGSNFSKLMQDPARGVY